VATVWTIGHSTRSLDEFVGLLAGHGIESIADVRRYPGSRRLPHFGRDALCAALEASGIAYEHMVELGGRRRALPDSPNTAWRSAQFRGYADYMMTAEFHAAVEKLRMLAATRRTAMMCAEALWWRCHRGLVADYLKAAGDEVLHVVAAGKVEPHPFTSAARIIDGRLSYAAGDDANPRLL
jgi:uncharacterized protein (DUF488 family)